jgi:hypothetical protein
MEDILFYVIMDNNTTTQSFLRHEKRWGDFEVWVSNVYNSHIIVNLLTVVFKKRLIFCVNHFLKLTKV